MPERASTAVDPRFPAMLRSLRQRAGLSLRALATASSYSRSYLWDLEADHKHPSPAVAGRLDATLAAGGALAALVVANGAAPVSGGPHRSTQAYRIRRTKGQRTRATDSRP